MAIEFDPLKDGANREEHGFSLSDFAGFDEEPVVLIDDRRDYGETRYRAFGRIDGKGHCLVFTLRGEDLRLISSAAHAKRRCAAMSENPEWTEKDFARARPAGELLPEGAAAQLVRRRGRPSKRDGERKEKVTLRLSPEVLAHFRAGGAGWQTRIDETLKDAMRGG